MDLLSTCNACGGSSASFPNSTCHVCHASLPKSISKGFPQVFHNPHLTSIDPFLLSLPHRDLVHTGNLPSTSDNTPSYALDLHLYEPTHDDPVAAPAAQPAWEHATTGYNLGLHLPTTLSLDFGLGTFLENGSNIDSTSHLFPTVPKVGDPLLASRGFLDAPWSALDLGQNTTTPEDLQSSSADLMLSMNLLSCASHFSGTENTSTLSSTQSSTTSVSSRQSRFPCDFPACEHTSQSAKDLTRHQLIHNGTDPTFSTFVITHRCICGKRTPRADNHKRHVMNCKAKWRWEDTSNNSYQCRCGQFHRAFGEHVRHLEDPHNGCGKARGRPAKARS